MWNNVIIWFYNVIYNLIFGHDEVSFDIDVWNAWIRWWFKCCSRNKCDLGLITPLGFWEVKDNRLTERVVDSGPGWQTCEAQIWIMGSLSATEKKQKMGA